MKINLLVPQNKQTTKIIIKTDEEWQEEKENA